MNRGVCAPGLRQSVDPFSGALECVRQRSYPDALNEEIGDPADATTSDHRRWCGKWIDAGSIVTGELKWAFFDEAAVEADVEDVLLAKGSGRLGVSDLSKFRCRTMVASDSAAAAGRLAFEHLDAHIGTVATTDAALETVGFLASHFCDAPATVGLTYGQSGFFVNLDKGVELGAETLREALYGVGADHSTRDHAAEFATAMAAIAAADLPLATGAEAQRVVLGSSRRGSTVISGPVPDPRRLQRRWPTSRRLSQRQQQQQRRRRRGGRAPICAASPPTVRMRRAPS